MQKIIQFFQVNIPSLKFITAWIKSHWFLALVALVGINLYGDFSHIRLSLYNLSMISFILICVKIIFANSKNWGIFPTLSIDDAITKASSEPLPTALMLVAITLLIITILFLSIPKLSIG